jgi:hypothetical protein
MDNQSKWGAKLDKLSEQFEKVQKTIGTEGKRRNIFSLMKYILSGLSTCSVKEHEDAIELWLDSADIGDPSSQLGVQWMTALELMNILVKKMSVTNHENVMVAFLSTI